MIELALEKPAMIFAPVLDSLKRLGRHRELIVVLAVDDLKRTYAGSVVGLAWILLKPLLVVSVYGILFGVVFQARTGTTHTSTEYLLLLLTGLLPWLAFAESLTAATGALTANASLISKTVFPIEVLPLSKVLAAMASGLVTIGLLTALLLWMGRVGWAACLVLPLLVLGQVCFTVGLAWLLASINVAVRDTTQLLPYALLTWMFLSPVVYTRDMVPALLATVFDFNPMSYFIDAYRVLLLDARVPSALLAQASIVAVLAFALGLWLIARVRHVATEFL